MKSTLKPLGENAKAMLIILAAVSTFSMLLVRMIPSGVLAQQTGLARQTQLDSTQQLAIANAKAICRMDTTLSRVENLMELNILARILDNDQMTQQERERILRMNSAGILDIDSLIREDMTRPRR